MIDPIIQERWNELKQKAFEWAGWCKGEPPPKTIEDLRAIITCVDELDARVTALENK